MREEIKRESFHHFLVLVLSPCYVVVSCLYLGQLIVSHNFYTFWKQKPDKHWWWRSWYRDIADCIFFEEQVQITDLIDSRSIRPMRNSDESSNYGQANLSTIHITYKLRHHQSKRSKLLYLSYTTEGRSSGATFASQPHHPISSASFNRKGWNLVCSTPWPQSAPTKNFSPIGQVVPEIWPNIWEKSQKRERRKESSKWPKNQGKLTITHKILVQMSWNFVWD